MTHYGRVEYWNQRYIATRDVEPFYEWYQNFASLRHYLTNEFLAPAATALKANTYSNFHAMTPPTPAATSPAPTFPPRSRCRTLILGCGNSRFGEDMLRDGWTGGIVNVDFSPVVIDHMKAKYNDAFYQRLGVSKTSRMEFVCADITKGALAAYDDGSFDLILCKGTFDAILSSAGSVANAKLVVQECHRLLADNHGVFMLVTFGNADSRVAFLEHQGDLGYYWQGVSVHVVPRKTRHSQESPSVVKKDYVYICRKCAGAPQSPVSSPYASLDGLNERNVAGEENAISAAPCKRSHPNRFS